MRHLRLQSQHFGGQTVDLLLGRDDFAEVHVIAVKAVVVVVGRRGMGQIRGGGDAGRGRGDGEHGAGRGGLDRALKLLDVLLQAALSGLQVTDLHLDDTRAPQCLE